MADAPTPSPALAYAGPLIFFSYRRKDSTDVTGRIYDELARHFGREALFKDVDSIPLGEDFRTVIKDAVCQCKVVLVIIGEKWLEITDETGGPRLANPNDYVRIEIETALEHAYKVIPVLVQDTRMPRDRDLPDSLQKLVTLNGCMVRPDPDFHRDMEWFVGQLKGICRAAVTTTATAGAEPSPAPAVGPVPPRPGEVMRVRLTPHSLLFYWWPVWTMGFLLGLFTYFENDRLAVVPAAARVTQAAEPGNYLITLPEGDRSTQSLKTAVERSAAGHDAFALHVPDNDKSYGTVFLVVLLLVILITNVPMSGTWSVVTIVGVMLFSILLAMIGAWDNLLASLATFRVVMNAGGILVISTVIFVLWLATVIWLDPRVYAEFTHDEVRVRDQIGGEEMVFSTTGMSIAKRREDLFLHWILGMGSGDVVLRTAGANGREIVMRNVLFVSQRLLILQRMLKDRPVVFGGIQERRRLFGG